MDEEIDKVEWHLNCAAAMRVIAQGAADKPSRNIFLQMAEDRERLCGAPETL
jgi:hypothetical protein